MKKNSNFSLKNNVIISKQVGAGAKPIQIVSPTAIATEQAKETVKQGVIGDNLLQSQQRDIKKYPIKKKLLKRQEKSHLVGKENIKNDKMYSPFNLLSFHKKS